MMNMGVMNKSVIVILITYIALVLKAVTGYELPGQVVDMCADAVMVIAPIVGFFMHPTKQLPEKKFAPETLDTPSDPNKFIQGKAEV